MAEPVISREVIARQAQAAAEARPRGTNPYCEHFQPEHHRVWAESFAQAVPAPQSEGATCA